MAKNTHSKNPGSKTGETPELSKTANGKREQAKADLAKRIDELNSKKEKNRQQG